MSPSSHHRLIKLKNQHHDNKHDHHHCHTQPHDHQQLENLDHRLNSNVGLLNIADQHVLQHLFKLTKHLAHHDHMRHQKRKLPRSLQQLNNTLTLTNVHPRIFNHLHKTSIPQNVFNNVHRHQKKHPTGQKR